MTIDTSKLTIALEEEERWHRTLSVVVPAEAVATERQVLIKQLAKRMKLPGFRKGKVPSGVVEKQYGQVLDREVVDKVIGQAYKHALEEKELSPISEGEVKTIQYEPQQDLSFTIGFDVRPEFELARMGGFKVERPSVEIPEEQLQKVLERLREQNASFEEAEGGQPEDGDVVSVTLARMEGEEVEEARPYQFQLGQGDAIPDVEEAIKSLEVGASGDFVVRFPDDFPNEERRGEEEQLRIEVTARQVMKLPELDDEFAAGLGNEEISSVDDLRSKILEDLQEEAAQRADNVVRSKLLDEVVGANPFTVPVSMVNRYLESILGDGEGVPEEQMVEAREKYAPEAERAVKQILVLEKIAEQQELKATEDEIDERVEEIAERMSENPSQTYARLQKAERLESIEREITERKVFDFLKSQSEITEN